MTNTFTQYNLAAPEKRLSNHGNRVGVAERFPDESVPRANYSSQKLSARLSVRLIKRSEDGSIAVTLLRDEPIDH